MKFVGFGEILVRLNPDGFYKLAQAEKFNVNYTGAEANTAINLSYMGVPSEFVTKLPENEIGDCARRLLSKFGVETKHIATGGERIGLYYLERGASQRSSKIVYDRKHSSISEADREDFDWEVIMRDASWFHFTGITVALNPQMADICADACRYARKYGVRISCDLNYRSKLWTQAQAQAAMKPLMKYVNVLIGNEEDAENVLGIKAGNSNALCGKIDMKGYAEVARQLMCEYGFDAIGTSLRSSVSASINEWSALLYTAGEVYYSPKYTIQLVDRVGGGDAFASGLIYGYMNGFSPQKAIDFATAASCLKQTIELDFNLSTAEEVRAVAEGNVYGRVQR